MLKARSQTRVAPAATRSPVSSTRGARSARAPQVAAMPAGAAVEAALPPGSPLRLLRLLWQVHHGLQSASKRMERDLGVTGPQRLVVRLLSESPGMTAGALADLLHLDPGTMSGIVQRLLRDRLVRRAADPHDRRRFLLALTPQGQRVASRREGTVEERVTLAVRELGPEEMRAAQRAMQVLASKLLDG